MRDMLDLAGLMFAVDDAIGLPRFRIDPLVHISQRIHNLIEPGQNLGFGQRAALVEHKLAQVFALNVIHH